MPRPRKPRKRATRRMLYWITMVLQETREEAGISGEKMAGEAGISLSKLKDIEAGKRWPGTRAQDIDHLVAVYARMTSKDGRLLWIDAAGRMALEGAPPLEHGRTTEDGHQPIERQALVTIFDQLLDRTGNGVGREKLEDVLAPLFRPRARRKKTG